MKCCGACNVTKPENHFFNYKEEFCIQCYRQPKYQRDIKKPKTYSELKRIAIQKEDMEEEDFYMPSYNDFIQNKKK